MTTLELIAFAVVLFVGVPSMLKNWTAAGLVGSFVILQVLALTTRQAMPLEVLLLCDFLVITIVFLKGPPLERAPASGLLSQAWACWVELSRADKIVLALFLPCWIAYAVKMGALPRYWILWTLGLLQFLAAGAEAFAIWRRGRPAASEAHPADWFLRQRYAGHGW